MKICINKQISLKFSSSFVNLLRICVRQNLIPSGYAVDLSLI
jgi:hypothetical protein